MDSWYLLKALCLVNAANGEAAVQSFHQPQIQTGLPSGKRSQKYGKSLFYSWVNQLFLWPFSIATVCKRLPEGKIPNGGELIPQLHYITALSTSPYQTTMTPRHTTTATTTTAPTKTTNTTLIVKKLEICKDVQENGFPLLSFIWVSENNPQL